VSASVSSKKILISGAAGNLGRKLIAHFLRASWCGGIVALDRAAGPNAGDRVRWVAADLADSADRRWREAMDGVDAAVHLAAYPNPDASWTDTCVSVDMTLNLLDAARTAGVRRFVFASSNHVMGGYKDPPLADSLEAGSLTTALTPAPGTRWFNGRTVMHGVAYGVSKLMGERACAASAVHSGGRLSTVSVRIGWCQPGENHPRSLNPSGVAGAAPVDDPDAERNLRWFRSMWLSNRDFAAVIERAILADSAAWPAPAIVVNGMSANSGMPWDLEATHRLIGYEPQDDVWRELGR
jgi:nucleoside-diphosphate-sugar epimerase